MELKLLCVCFLGLLRPALFKAPIAQIAQGQLRGKNYITRNGRTAFGFLGIPFAKPPVGNLRFRSPQPPEKWSGIRDATQDTPPCVQNNLLDYRNRNVTFGSEDCLHLNVFTPKLCKNTKLPVMVYIFGGGFTSGSISSKVYSPEYLLDKDIVLVVINHRLGPLGFISTEDDALPGNYGLKDQAYALKWVQKNIRFFGGNKNSVTIFGNSAGGGSVHLHMMSPLSAGLFHGAISESGSGLCSWAMHPPGSNRKTAYRVANEFGCPTNNSEALANCLREVPAYNITTLINTYLTFDLDPVVSFPPSIESDNEDAFLIQDPWLITTKVPWINGVVSEEGAMRTTSLIRGGAEGVARVARLNAEYKQLMPATIMIEKHAKNPIEISERVKKFYFGKDPISEAKLPALVNMYSDSWFKYCATEAGVRHKGPLYQYYMSYKGNKTVAFLFGNTDVNLGVCHVDELIYLFPLNAYFPNRTDTEQDIKFSQNLVEFWTNFAANRSPNPRQKPSTKWDKVTNQREYLHMSNNGFKMEKNLFEGGYQFWRDLPFREKPSPLP